MRARARAQERSHSKATAAQSLIDFVSATFTQNRGRQSGQVKTDTLRTTSADSLPNVDYIFGGGSPQDLRGGFVPEASTDSRYTPEADRPVIDFWSSPGCPQVDPRSTSDGHHMKSRRNPERLRPDP